LACYFVFGVTVDALKWATFSALLVVLTITDLRERILPDSVNFFGVGAGLLFSFFTSPMDGTAAWIANRWFEFPPPQPALSFADAVLGPRLAAGCSGRWPKDIPAARTRGHGAWGRENDGGRGSVSRTEANVNDRACRLTSGKRNWYRSDLTFKEGPQL